ncbi:hypothetical protein SAMD00019534_003590 [Acytostelium subglobosum LB1]|uniref:hypothetical protein n=1 Tax=Acytostelium subglobosum LB1 TaxID=1410327 RepID=UPI000644C1AE|nr:hypothetical protein SAMD00019534_003590 [Acytostelium subglobosum LB1]GAM17184.1 hypothetical protein SAMD00019534_003590 [Acytostelium subglobosum LB1]|eukprot:XP_012759246.1 hypothetical protein SAMD00019534_003590 [Acytostelium subglobosum LB1]
MNRYNNNSTSVWMVLAFILLLNEVTYTCAANTCVVDKSITSSECQTNPLICTSISLCLKQLIKQGQLNNTVLVTPDQYNQLDCPGSVPVPLGSLTITSTSPSDNPIFDCNNSTFIVINVTPTGNQQSTIILDSITITSGTNEQDGGCIQLNNDNMPSSNILDITVSNCNVSFCKSYGNGGFMASFGYNVTIVNTTVTNCTSAQSAGVLLSITPTMLINSVFEKNHAHNAGGVFSGMTQMSAINCTFDSNSAFVYGGAAIGLSMQFNQCTFMSNSADFAGGALYMPDGSYGVVSNSSFMDNQINAGDGGGAIFSNNSRLHLYNNIFSGNYVAEDGDGGAIYVMGEGGYQNGNFDFSTNQFLDNMANGNGGAIYFRPHVSINILNLTGALFIDNQAGQYGGGIYFNSYPKQVNQGLFEYCSSKE